MNRELTVFTPACWRNFGTEGADMGKGVFMTIMMIAIFAKSIATGTPAGTEASMYEINRSMLCVTEGTLQETTANQVLVNVPKMRAYVNRLGPQTIAARFAYLGPSDREIPLQSGATRRQFGLKLHAQDACNLVYAMWRFEPEAKLVVSVKSNPDLHTSAECGNRGYRNIKPVQQASVPLPRPGEIHELRAEANGEQLRVFVDGAVVWNGALGKEARDLTGPVGIRSDNVKLQFQLYVGQLSGTAPLNVLGCQTGTESE